MCSRSARSPRSRATLRAHGFFERRCGRASWPTSTSATGCPTSCGGRRRRLRRSRARCRGAAVRIRPEGESRSPGAASRSATWEQTWSRDGARRCGRGGARGDRARRRLPGEPRPAPLGAVLRRPGWARRASSRPLRPLHPRPFVGDGWAIVSASPELFLARSGRQVWTMPIKGTRPAGGARPHGVREGRGRARDDRRPRAERPVARLRDRAP